MSFDARKRALERLKTRRQAEVEVASEIEASRVELEKKPCSHRSQWREGVKYRRRENLESLVDRKILEESVYSSPSILASVQHALSGLGGTKSLPDRDINNEIEQLNLNSSLMSTVTSMTHPLRDENKSSRNEFLSRTLPLAQLLAQDSPSKVSAIDQYGEITLIDQVPNQQKEVTEDPSPSASPHGSTSEAPSLERQARSATPVSPLDAGKAPLLLHPKESVPVCSLADCLFLAGPSKEGIAALIAKHAAVKENNHQHPLSPVDSPLQGTTKVNSPTRNRTNAVHATPPKPGTSPGGNILSFSDMVDPHMLFSTSNDPDLEEELLPYFCFPSGVSVSTNSAKGRHTSSVLNVVSPITPTRIGGSKQRKTFVFMLTNNLSTQYGICLLIPRSVHDAASGVIVNFEYCLCSITRLPFLTYLRYTLALFEAYEGLGSTDFLPTHKRGMDLPPEFHLLQDLATSLKSTKVPVYAHITTSNYGSGGPEGAGAVVGDSDCNGDKFTPLSALTALPTTHEEVKLRINVSAQRRMEIPFRRQLLQHHYLTNSGAPGLDFPESLRVDDTDPRASYYLNEAALDRDSEARYQTMLWALPILLRHLPLDQIILAVGCALSEMKLVVLSPDPVAVSGCLHALLQLLRPLRWAGNVVITLPAFLNELLESPSFYFLGMNALPEGFELSSGLVVVNPHDHVVHLHPTDVVTSHTINVPQSAKLLASLKKPAETILQTYRRESRRRSTSIGSRSDAASTHSSVANDVFPGATFIGIDGAYLNDEVSLPYPAEIDTFSVSGTIMQDAVGEFLSIFKEHLSTLADTAVKMAHEEKRGRSMSLLSTPLSPLPEELEKSTGNTRRVQGVDNANPSILSPASTIHVRRADSNGSYGQLPDRLINSDTVNHEIQHDNIAEEEDQDVDTDQESVSSVSSLPALPHDAQFFSHKDIGDSGMKFIKRLQETQAFSNYCFERTELGQKRRVDNMFAMFTQRAHQVAQDAVIGNAEVQVSAAFSTNSEVPRLRQRTVQVLFETILSGTCALNETQLTSLRTSYQANSVVQTQRLGSARIPTGIDDVALPHVHNLASSMYPLNGSKWAHTSQDTQNWDSEALQSILWCNGRCGGRADTPQCTSICLIDWESRVRSSKKGKMVTEIIQKHHQVGDAVLAELYLPEGGRLQLNTRAAPVKHPKETREQYLLRLRLSGLDTHLADLPSDSASSEAKDSNHEDGNHQFRLLTSVNIRKSARAQPSISTPSGAAAFYNTGYSANYSHIISEESTPPLTPAINTKGEVTGKISKGSKHFISEKCNPQTSPLLVQALVGFYNRRYQTHAHKERLISKLKLTGPLLRWIWKYRRRKYYAASTAINSAIRGYLVRINKEQLWDILRGRKLQRYLAMLVIRNWFRKIPQSVFDRLKSGEGVLLYDILGSAVATAQQVSTTGVGDVHMRIKSWKVHLSDLKISGLLASKIDVTVSISAVVDPSIQKKSRKTAKAIEYGSTLPVREVSGACAFDEDFDIDVEESHYSWYFRVALSQSGLLGHLSHIAMGAVPFEQLLKGLAFSTINEIPESKEFRGLSIVLSQTSHSLLRGEGLTRNYGVLEFNAMAEPQYELPKALQARATVQRTRFKSSDDEDSSQNAMKNIGNASSPNPAAAVSSPYHSVQGMIGSFFTKANTPPRVSAVTASVGEEMVAEPSLNATGLSSMGEPSDCDPDTRIMSDDADSNTFSSEAVLTKNITRLQRTASDLTHDMLRLKRLSVNALNPQNTSSINQSPTSVSSATGKDNKHDTMRPLRGVSAMLQSAAHYGGPVIAKSGDSVVAKSPPRSKDSVLIVKGELRGAGASNVAEGNTASRRVLEDPTSERSNTSASASTSLVASNEARDRADTMLTSNSSGSNRIAAEDDMIQVAISPKSVRLAQDNDSHVVMKIPDEITALDNPPEQLAIEVSVKDTGRSRDNSTYFSEDYDTNPSFLVNLGPTVNHYFTSQQLDMLSRTFDLLRGGIEIVKHGRSGTPRERILYCDYKLDYLYWTAPTGELDGRLTNTERDQMEAILKERSTELGGAAMPRERTGFLGFRKTDSDRLLLLREVLDVRDEVETDVMQRSERKGYLLRKSYTRNTIGFVGENGNKIISIIGVSRTFDFEIAAPDFSQLFHALQVLINFYRVKRSQDQGESVL